MLFVLMLVGLGIQTWKGFYDYEIHLYLKRLFLLDWTGFILLCVLAFTVQTIVSNKYLGHFIIILYFLFGMFKGMLGFNHTLYYYGSGSGATYSDMNGLRLMFQRYFGTNYTGGLVPFYLLFCQTFSGKEAWLGTSDLEFSRPRFAYHHPLVMVS